MTAARFVGRPLRAVQVGFHADVEGRDPAALLEAWPTLPAVASAVRRAGVEVTVVQASRRRQTLERDGVTYHFVDDERATPRCLAGVPIRRRPRRLLDVVRALDPDVVHVHGLNHPLAVRQLARAVPGVPVLVQDHGSPPPRGWRTAAWRWAYRSLAGVAFTAREQASPFLAVEVLPRGAVVCEVLEASSTFVPGDRDAAREATGMGGDPCLLWTGRLDANKDPLTTLDAFEMATPHLPDARLWCCFGTAPLLDRVRARIERAPALRERVVLVGSRPHAEMELRFRAADFFVQTSHREGSGYSLLEAMACGAFPLVTDIAASRRIVGSAGSLTPVGDARALAAAMVSWAGYDRAALRRAAHDRFEHALTYDVVGRQLRRAYESLAGR